MPGAHAGQFDHSRQADCVRNVGSFELTISPDRWDPQPNVFPTEVGCARNFAIYDFQPQEELNLLISRQTRSSSGCNLNSVESRHVWIEIDPNTGVAVATSVGYFERYNVRPEFRYQLFVEMIGLDQCEAYDYSFNASILSNLN